MSETLDLLGLNDSDQQSPAPVVVNQTETSATPPANENNAANEPPHITCPITGELIDLADIDSLIDCYERISEVDARLYSAKGAIRQALSLLTEGNAKTRRIQGHRRKAIVEFPSTSFDQTALKRIWENWPDIREQALKIGIIDVKRREFSKLLNTSGVPELEAFRNAIANAEKPASGLPSIKVEA